MSHTQTFTLNEKTRPLVAIAGAVLVLLGLHQLWLGWKNRPLPVAGDEVAEVAVPDQIEDTEPLFRMVLDREEGSWVMVDANESERWPLPAVLPAPPTWQAPARLMTLTGWRDFLGGELESGKLTLSNQALAAMGTVVVSGERPFQNLENSGVASGEFNDRSSGVIGSIPGELDPRSPIFERQMRAWRGRVRQTIRKAPVFKDGYHFDSSHPTISGRRKLVVTSIARSRILAGDFGQKRRDILIYLQVLCNFHGEFIKIDGVTGPQTRKSVAAMAFLVFADDATRKAYLQKLRPWIGA